jgi:hypothetical protein
MVSYTKEELMTHISDIECQVDYLKQAIEHKIVDEQEEYRLNALIVKKAHLKKELEQLENHSNIHCLLDKFKRFSRKPALISDYFTH